MTTFAFHTLYFGSKLLKLENKLFSSDLENRLGLMFLLTDLYFSLILLGFFLLLGFKSFFAVPYFLVMFALILMETIKKKPIMTKNVSQAYEKYCSISNT